MFFPIYSFLYYKFRQIRHFLYFFYFCSHVMDDPNYNYKYIHWNFRMYVLKWFIIWTSPFVAVTLLYWSLIRVVFLNFLTSLSIFFSPIFNIFYSIFDFLYSIKLFFYSFFETCCSKIFILYDNIFFVYNYFLSNKFLFLFFLFLMYFFNIFLLSLMTFFFGTRGVFLVALFSITPFWLIQLFFLNDLFYNSTVFYINFDFINFFIGSLSFSFSFKFDFLNFCFLFLTTTIGLCAIVYSLSYFKNEPNTDRFILLLNWFILSMSLLVLSDNALLLFLGWELIGLTSFFLINFWTLRRGTLKSAIKAFTFNKISDVFLLYFIIIMAHQTQSLNLTDWQNFLLTNNIENFKYMNIPGIFLIFASSIKSAQLFGHLWLPDSMEAPIPASALIHSATLVSAGVYLLLKFNWLVSTTSLSFVIFILGIFTSLYGAVVSASQTDCKKLLAYSTISHCGFLFITISMNNIYLTVTYLYLHGFFKALTFFCVGNLVKVSKGYQDTRKMGQLFLLLPIESCLLVFCAINLGALPFTVGYFYKFLFQSFFLNNDFLPAFLFFLFFSMLSSIIYVYRLVFYSLFDVQKGNELSYNNYLKKKYHNYQHSNSTKMGWLFLFMLIIFSTVIMNLYILTLKDFIIFNLSCDCKISQINMLFTPINVNYLLFFYAFFVTMVCLLIAVECRVSFNYLHNRSIILFIFSLFSFWQVMLFLVNHFF